MPEMQTERIELIRLDQIELSQNIRLDIGSESIDKLAGTIGSVGQQQPVRLYLDGDVYRVVDGARRCFARKLRGDELIPAIVERRTLSEEERITRQLICDLQHESVPPMNRAVALRSLMDIRKCSASEVAAMLGTTGASVSQLLKLLKLSAPIQEAVAAQRIPASVAYELSHVDDPAWQAELAQLATEGKATRADIKRARKQPKPSEKRKRLPRGGIKLKLIAGLYLTVSAGALKVQTLLGLLERLLTEAKLLPHSNETDVADFLKSLGASEA